MGIGDPASLLYPRKIEVEPWSKWFAWYPVKIHGNRVWIKTVYRRCIVSYVDMDKWVQYEYGTLFDVLQSSK
jgi:hypothetical protein